MITKRKESSRIRNFLEASHREALERGSTIVEELGHMQYEGKASLHKNVRKLHQTLRFFDEDVLAHMSLEEDVLFPYLEMHVPKFSGTVRFLQAEHDNFRNGFKVLSFLVKELARAGAGDHRAETIEQIRETGTYLVYLLRHHIEAEEKSVYHLLEKELRAEELHELKKRIRGSRPASQ